MHIGEIVKVYEIPAPVKAPAIKAPVKTAEPEKVPVKP